MKMALHGKVSNFPSTPFFPLSRLCIDARAAGKPAVAGIAVFGADLWASDWNPMTPEQQLKLLTDRLDDSGGGIILLHDTKAQTAKMLPAFLQYLRRNDYKVVHILAAQPAKCPATTGSSLRN